MNAAPDILTWEVHRNVEDYLRKTKSGTPIIGTLKAFEGIVASHGFSTLSVFTTPNQCWIPEFAVAHGEIMTYSDGRWGRHEYSRWPQGYSPDCLHLACIPRQPSFSNGPSRALWRTLTFDDWKKDDCGVAGVGFICKERMDELGAEASAAIEGFASCRQDREKWVREGRMLVICLRHVLDRLRMLPAPQGVAIALAAHAQRLIFELAGLTVLLDTVLARIESQSDYACEVLDVVGAHTPDPITAEVLYRAGIPIWFQQPLTGRLSIYGVVAKTDIPIEFSQVPAYPRLVLEKKDTSGTLNMAGVWARAMNALLRRQLCASSLPELSASGLGDYERPPKRHCDGMTAPHGSGSPPGPPIPTIKLRNPQDAKTIGHALLRSEVSGGELHSQTNIGDPTRHSRRPRDGEPKHSARTSITGPSLRPFVLNPFRQFYPSRNVFIAESWSNALRRAGPLPQPTSSATFYYPPPWLLDSLVGYDSNPAKIARHLHHLVSIRTFCRLRLFDPTIAGRPLTSAEWRDALYGDYHPETRTASEHKVPRTRMAVRHHSRASLRRLFGGIASLRSYDNSAAPMLAGKIISYETALTDKDVQRRLVWESHEINWRCELLALDALEVGSKDWPEMERWAREADVSRVWGSHTSGIDIAPPPGVDMTQYCWSSSMDSDWEAQRVHLQGFLDILSRWSACPKQLYDLFSIALHCTAAEYDDLLDCAIAFYVDRFVTRYQRLPIPPVRGVCPTST